MLYKSVKYSYFWSFSDFGEENKMCWKLIFTTHKILYHRLENLVGWNYYIAGSHYYRTGPFQNKSVSFPVVQMHLLLS